MKAKARDEADIASEQEQYARDEAIWKAKHTAPSRATGRCYNCGEACDSFFCDVGCRQDYEKRERFRQHVQAAIAKGEDRGNRWPVLHLPKTKRRLEENERFAREDRRTFDKGSNDEGSPT